MLVYVDSVICIYAVEGPSPFQARACSRLAQMQAAGDQVAISDLTWLECRVKPIRLRDAAALAEMEAFLRLLKWKRLPLPFAVYERACHIRASYKYSLADALHLAAALHGGCEAFLTNDHRLSGFPDLSLEILP